MSILSVRFILFLAGLLILYYLLPRRFQWGLLLLASLCFYLLSGWQTLPFLLLTSLSVWASALWIHRLAEREKAELKARKAEMTKQDRAARKAAGKRQRRRIMVLCLVLNFGILCAFKYIHFLLAQANGLAGIFGGQVRDTVRWIAPLGISFYTFQTVGYLCDVYWENCPAEKSIWKVLLFTSFFPQITQGPISTWRDLSGELFRPHSLDDRSLIRGSERLLWGYFKKMVVANIFSGYVQTVFTHYGSYSGPAVFLGALCYSVQIYADFSGYMDIMCGYCQMLGISLTENFQRPYFSKSIAEYWRRWHISLGTWFKNYLYYPLAVARWNQNLGKAAKRRLGKAVGAFLPATLSLVVVWLTTGLWHGASWAYIAWGGVNGLFIIFSMWMEKTYGKWKQALRIRETSWFWRAFQVLRTFTLVTFIKVLPEVGTLHQGFGLWKRIFTGPLGSLTFSGLLPFVDKKREFLAAMAGVGLMFLVSLLQRRGSLRVRMEKHLPFAVRLLLFVVLFFVIVYFGVPASGGLRGFLYAEF